MKTSLSAMLFPVKKSLITEELGIDAIGSCEYGIFANLKGKTTLLNTCSETYELLTNRSIFQKIEDILTKGNIKFTVEYKMIDFSRFYADYTIRTGGISVGNRKDLIYPVLRVEHSYNGLMKYKMTFGYFRMICTNGLVVPVEGKEESNFTVVGKHTASIQKSLDTLIEKIEYFTKNNKKFSEKFTVVAERWVENWVDRVETVIAVSGVGKRGFDQITEKIKEEAELFNGGKVNDWLIYNGINYHIFNAITTEGKEYATAPNLRRDSDRKVWETIYNNPNTLELKKQIKVTA